MAVSGTATFSYNRNQIIKAAGRKVGAFEAGETPNAQVVTDFSDALNMMVKHWNGRGIHLWTVSEGVLFPQLDQVTYQIGPSATDHSTETYYSTTLSADEASGQTTLSITSTTNIAVSDNIGIVLDSGSIFWTTVSSKTSTTVTVASALTGAASSGANVFNYTTRIQVKPLRIPSARRYNVSSAIDTPLDPPMSRREYRDMPNKTSTGVISRFYYDPQRALGYFNVWPEPVDLSFIIKFTYYRPIMDFSAAADDPDLPQEWLNTLVWNLAYEMAPEFGVDDSTYMRIKDRAENLLEEISGWDREPESAYFGVDFSQMYG